MAGYLRTMALQYRDQPEVVLPHHMAEGAALRVLPPVCSHTVHGELFDMHRYQLQPLAAHDIGKSLC